MGLNSITKVTRLRTNMHIFDKPIFYISVIVFILIFSPFR